MMRYLAGILLLLTALTGCGGSGSSSSGGSGDVPGDNGGGDQEPVVGRTFVIEPGESATNDMVTAMIAARPGDTIEFSEGYFELRSGLQNCSTENIHIKGQGMNETILYFK